MKLLGGAHVFTLSELLTDNGPDLHVYVTDNAGMRRPTLDDVFLQLTGRSSQTDEAETENVA